MTRMRGQFFAKYVKYIRSSRQFSRKHPRIHRTRSECGCCGPRRWRPEGHGVTTPLWRMDKLLAFPYRDYNSLLGGGGGQGQGGTGGGGGGGDGGGGDDGMPLAMRLELTRLARTRSRRAIRSLVQRQQGEPARFAPEGAGGSGSGSGSGAAGAGAGAGARAEAAEAADLLREAAAGLVSCDGAAPLLAAAAPGAASSDAGPSSVVTPPSWWPAALTTPRC